MLCFSDKDKVTSLKIKKEKLFFYLQNFYIKKYNFLSNLNKIRHRRPFLTHNKRRNHQKLGSSIIPSLTEIRLTFAVTSSCIKLKPMATIERPNNK